MTYIMFKEKVDSIKQALVKVDGPNNKKSLENLITIAILLIVTIIAINYIWKDDKKKAKSNGNLQYSLDAQNKENYATEAGVQGSDSYSSDSCRNGSDLNNLETKLEDILSKINGVGEVKVLLTYSQTQKINPIYNEDEQSSTTEETDTSGGKRVISSTNNKREVVQSNNSIITQSISCPQVQGAVVIAKGADDINIKTNIIQAVSAATGLSTYKIQVFEMN